jgi:hypothetical protein
LPLLLDIILEGDKERERERERGVIQTEKGALKLFLFADDIILNIQNPKDSTKKTVRTDTFSKVVGLKNPYINAIMFPYTDN